LNDTTSPGKNLMLLFKECLKMAFRDKRLAVRASHRRRARLIAGYRMLQASKFYSIRLEESIALRNGAISIV
jgi:hypothetical protein